MCSNLNDLSNKHFWCWNWRNGFYGTFSDVREFKFHFWIKFLMLELTYYWDNFWWLTSNFISRSWNFCTYWIPNFWWLNSNVGERISVVEMFLTRILCSNSSIQISFWSTFLMFELIHCRANFWYLKSHVRGQVLQNSYN